MVLAETDTGVGKISETLQEGYENLEKSYGNEKDFDNAVTVFSNLVSSLKNKTIEELDKTDNGTEEYQDYRTSVLADYKELATYTNELSNGNISRTLRKIKNKVVSEKPFMALGNDLPFENVANDNVTIEKYTAEDVDGYKTENKKYNKSDLEVTNDTIINDKVRSEFQELTSPLEIYQYIKDNYLPEFYYGSRKGAVGIYEQKAGNDYDIASLLIGIFRDRNIPARYVRGEIEISAEQAMKWTATEDIDVALRLIAALGIPATGLTSKGDVVAVRLEHVWVEAYVPYTDYRGAGNQAGESLWIPLDPSFKEISYVNGVDISSISDYVSNEDNFLTADTEMNGVNVGGLSSAVDGQDSAFVKYMLENGYGEATLTEAFGGREIVSEDLGYLPLSLPYSVTETIETFDDIPENLTDSITVSLVGNSTFELDFYGKDSIKKKLYTPDIYGKRVVLQYTPATDADKEVLDKYGSIFKTPAYLLKLKPQLIVDGEVVAEGSACNAGYMQKYSIKIHNAASGKNDESVENSIVAGGMYCIALDYGTISADRLQDSADDMEALKESISEANIYTDEAMGEMLNSVANSYFAHLDLYNSVVAGQNNVTATRDFSVGIVGFNANVVYTFNRPAELNEGGIFLDIGHDVHSVISNENDNNDEKAYMLQSGIYASAMEHGILEQVTGVESISTIKVLEYAQANNIPIHTIAKENLSDEIDVLTVAEQIKQEIKSSVNAGRVVIIPEQEITLNQWSGVGYMVLDPDSFACGYMISGGLAGGSMTASQMIGEYVAYVLMGAVFMVVWEVLTTILLAMTPCGWLTAMKLFVNTMQLIMLVTAVLQILDLWDMYQRTGDIKYLQEMAVQVAAIATLGIATKLLGNKLTNLKNKITEAIDKAGLKGACFVAGTLVLSTAGFVPIESIVAGNMVQSFDPITQEVSAKEVEEAFVRESSELVHISVGNETITTTPEHPFYTIQKEFVKAIKLRAGDILCTVNGEYVVVEQIQHEILESPIKVYNFRVVDNHTYYVGDTCVGVHNAECVNNNSSTGESGKGNEKQYTDQPFDENGKLKPDVKYQTGEYNYNYETDANGRISRWNTDNLKLTERGTRLKHDPNTPGKQPGDHAGHLAADRFGGSPEIDNLVSQSSNVNLSKYKVLENKWANAIKEGKNVAVDVNIEYQGNSMRPSKFIVKYAIDGKSVTVNLQN